jgi:hypothetical protein
VAPVEGLRPVLTGQSTMRRGPYGDPLAQQDPRKVPEVFHASKGIRSYVAATDDLRALSLAEL